MQVKLASASPRRKEILELLGIPFSIEVSSGEEKNDAPVPPDQLVLGHARSKALDVAAHSDPDTIVIGADTIVVCEGVVLGKPSDAEDAKRMLALLAARTHQVYTGIAVVQGKQIWSHCEKTEVDMGPLDERELAAYVATGEPLDKAGAYAIQGQGARFIRGIRGCYQNVVGLPLFALVDLLRQTDLPL